MGDDVSLGGDGADCNPQCWRARSPVEKCNCSCGGAHHGGFYTENDQLRLEDCERMGAPLLLTEEQFEKPDPDNEDISHTEVDLYAKLYMTIRHNKAADRYEIVKIDTGHLVFASKELSKVADKANELEEDKNFTTNPMDIPKELREQAGVSP